MCILKKVKGFHEKLGRIKQLNNKGKLSIMASNRVNFKKREQEGCEERCRPEVRGHGVGTIERVPCPLSPYFSWE